MSQDANRVSRLIQELKHTDRERRADVAMALEAIGEPAVEPLCNLLRDASAEVLAAETMGTIGGALREEIVEICSLVAVTLGGLGAPAVQPLCEALQDTNPRARSLAAAILGEIGDARAVPALCTALWDEDRSVTWSAAFALGKIGNPEAVVPLCKALQDGSVGLRYHVVEALGRIGDPKAVLPLYGAREEKNTAVRARVTEALDQIVLRESVAEALVELGAAAILPLCEVLKGVNVEARCQAAQVLGRIAEQEPAPALREAVPLLRRLLARRREPDDSEQQLYRAALERIDTATAAMNFPLPAAAHPPSPDDLPIPAKSPAADPERLPLPATPPAASRDTSSPLDPVPGGRGPAPRQPVSKSGLLAGWVTQIPRWFRRRE